MNPYEKLPSDDGAPRALRLKSMVSVWIDALRARLLKMALLESLMLSTVYNAILILAILCISVHPLIHVQIPADVRPSLFISVPIVACSALFVCSMSFCAILDLRAPFDTLAHKKSPRVIYAAGVVLTWLVSVPTSLVGVAAIVLLVVRSFKDVLELL